MRTSRWRGEPGRLEVWYTTITDPATGTGFWLHTELVAPSSPGAPAYLHGWAAVFPPDAPPTWERFGPTPADGRVQPTELTGATETLRWDLAQRGPEGPWLWTFPRWAWERQLLPAAQVVPAPTARYDGSFAVGDEVHVLEGAVGASARIYGHGNARRWGWLHADLSDGSGGGDVLEVVAAVSTRPGLALLPPLVLLALRLDGEDLGGDPLLRAPLLRARLGLPEWRVSGLVGPGRRIGVRVVQDPARTAVVPYTDPDGGTATCHNSEVASAFVRLDRLTTRGWRQERAWHLDRTAHAEVGLRP